MGQTRCLSTRVKTILTGAGQRKSREKSGRRSEWLAEILLRLKGYQILERRYKTKQGEIDIIARKKNVLIIAEVKQRQSLDKAKDSITDYARLRITRAAETYYARTPKVQNLALRFDGIFIAGRWKITHVKDLWRDY